MNRWTPLKNNISCETSSQAQGKRNAYKSNIMNTVQYVPSTISGSCHGSVRRIQLGIRNARWKIARRQSAQKMLDSERAWIGEPRAATASRFRTKRARTAEAASGRRPRAGKARSDAIPWAMRRIKAGGKAITSRRRRVTVLAAEDILALMMNFSFGNFDYLWLL